MDDDWGDDAPLRPQGLDNAGDGCFVMLALLCVGAIMAMLLLAAYER